MYILSDFIIIKVLVLSIINVMINEVLSFIVNVAFTMKCWLFLIIYWSLTASSIIYYLLFIIKLLVLLLLILFVVFFAHVKTCTFTMYFLFISLLHLSPDLSLLSHRQIAPKSIGWTWHWKNFSSSGAQGWWCGTVDGRNPAPLS